MFIKRVRWVPHRGREYLFVEVYVRVLGPLGPVTYKGVKSGMFSPDNPVVFDVDRLGDYVVVKAFDAEFRADIIVEGNITRTKVVHPGGLKYNNRWVTYTISAIHII